MTEEIFSLSTCAERLGTSTRRLRYFLEKDPIIPDRRMRAGRYQIRYFNDEDLKTLTRWWNVIHGGNDNDND